MMRNLYEIKEGYKQIQSFIEEGELDQEMLQDTFEGIDGEFEEKAENCGLVIKNWQAEAEMIDNEIKRLQERSNKLKADADSLQQRVFDAMAETGKTKFSTEHFRFGARKSEYVDISEGATIPMVYIKTKVTSSPDKVAIKKAIKSGKVIEGVTVKSKLNYSMK